jgi:hypothetical protein
MSTFRSNWFQNYQQYLIAYESQKVKYPVFIDGFMYESHHAVETSSLSDHYSRRRYANYEDRDNDTYWFRFPTD